MELIVNDKNIPKILGATYANNFRTFQNWAKNHRDHQKEAILAIEANVIGQVSLPTGTGKTRVQVHTHVSTMIDSTKLGVYVIAYHRLALNQQLLSDLIEVAVNAGIQFDIMFIGSDQVSGDRFYKKFRNKGFTQEVCEFSHTLKQEEVLTSYQKAQARNRHLIVVSTYHSFDKLSIIPEIALCTYDEAHTLIGNDDKQLLQNIIAVPNILRKYFFTATRKV